MQALQDFVVQTNARFKQHDKRISALEKQVSQVVQRNGEIPRQHAVQMAPGRLFIIIP